MRGGWLGLSRENLLATGQIAYYGACHNDFGVNDTTTGIKYKKSSGKHLVPRSWMNVDERGWSSRAASWVSSATWKRATPEVPRLALARSLITNRNCLCFESMVNKLKWKKRPRGQRHFQMSSNLFWEILHFAKEIQFLRFLKNTGLIWGHSCSLDDSIYHSMVHMLILNVIESRWR